MRSDLDVDSVGQYGGRLGGQAGTIADVTRGGSSEVIISGMADPITRHRDLRRVVHAHRDRMSPTDANRCTAFKSYCTQAIAPYATTDGEPTGRGDSRARCAA